MEEPTILKEGYSCQFLLLTVSPIHRLYFRKLVGVKKEKSAEPLKLSAALLKKLLNWSPIRLFSSPPTWLCTKITFILLLEKQPWWPDTVWSTRGQSSRKLWWGTDTKAFPSSSPGKLSSRNPGCSRCHLWSCHRSPLIFYPKRISGF